MFPLVSLLCWGVLVAVCALIGIIWGRDEGGDQAEVGGLGEYGKYGGLRGFDGFGSSIVGALLILLGLLVIRFGRRRLLALFGSACVVVGILGILYAPILSHKSWVVWLQFIIVIAVLGLIFLMKLWNPLTGLHHRLAKGTGRRRGDRTDNRSSSSHSSPSSAAELTVLSWNVFLRSVASQKFMDNDFKEERVGPIVRAVCDSGADVVCLQEASSTLNYRVHRLIKAARRKGYPYSVCPAPPPVVCRKMVDSGLLILSKLPIESADTIALPSGLGDDALMHKAVQQAVVTTDRARPASSAVRILNTHVQSEYALDTARDHYSKTKAKQYRRIADVVRRGTLPVILCGDLNCDGIGDKDRCERLQKSLAMDSYAPVGQPTIDIRYDPGTGTEIQTEFYVDPPSSTRGTVVPRAMDYIMSSSRRLRIKESRVLDNGGGRLGVRLSDHRPVLATLSKS